MREQYPEADGPLTVHRLDMATSGLMLIAKTKRCLLYTSGGGQAAYSAYRHDLSRWNMTLFLLTT